jgi:hypothetical protein
MVMLGDGSDILGAVVVLGRGDGAWPELAGRVRQRVAQVLEQPEAVAGYVEATLAAGGPSSTAPDQGQADGLAGGLGR